MRATATALLPKAVQERWREKREYSDWTHRGFAAPSPSHIKRETILRHNLPEATWVETGTFLGDTTAVLADHSRMVYSIEPEPTLFANAVKRFSGRSDVELLNGISEEVLPALVPRLNGNVCFWLDGHFSHGSTYQGPKDCPVVEELAVIRKHKTQFGGIRILIDDVRLFNADASEYRDYPTTDYLVDWSRSNGFAWSIEHDIFIASLAWQPARS